MRGPLPWPSGQYTKEMAAVRPPRPAIFVLHVVTVKAVSDDVDFWIIPLAPPTPSHATDALPGSCTTSIRSAVDVEMVVGGPAPNEYVAYALWLPNASCSSQKRRPDES